MELSDNFIVEKVDAKTLASIIPTIVSGLYANIFDLVREYCQNAYDALLEEYGERAHAKGRVDITIDGTTVTIHDNGTGMPKDVIEKCATIGYSTKDVSHQVGYRGIGRLSGICGAEQIHFVTQTKDDPHEYSFEIDAKAITASLDRNTKFTAEAADILRTHSKLKKRVVIKDYESHFTTVVLYGLYGEAGKILNEDQLRSYLEVNLPVPINPRLPESDRINSLYMKYEKKFPNIQFYLNNKQIFKPYHIVEGDKEYKEIILKNNRGKELAIAWLLWDPYKSGMIDNEFERLRGIRYRYRGFTIGDNGTVRNILKTSPPQIPDWFMGEIVVLDDDAKVSSDRSRFEDSTSRSDLENALKNILTKTIEKIARDKSKQNSVKKIINKAKTDLSSLKKDANSAKYVSKVELKAKLRQGKEISEKLRRVQKDKTVNNEYKQKVASLREDINTTLTEIEQKTRDSKELEDLLSKNDVAEAIYNIVKNVITMHFKGNGYAAELISKIEHKLIKELGKSLGD